MIKGIARSISRAITKPILSVAGGTSSLSTPTSLVATESAGTVILTWADANSDGRTTDPYVTILGSSTAVGTGASSEAAEWADGLFQTWWLANFKGAGYINRALGGQTLTNLRPSPNGTAGRRTTDAINDGATLSIINMPSNDTTAAVAVATQIAYLDEIYSDLNTNSIFPLITSTQPRNLGVAGSAQRKELANQDQTTASLGSGVLSDYNQDSTNNSYKENFNTVNFVSIYQSLVDDNPDPSNGAFTGTLGTYDTGDGTHLNDAGHAIVYAAARDQVIAWVDAGSSADNIVIERRIDSGAWATLATLTTPFTRYVDSSPLGTVEYRVKATATGYSDSSFTSASTPIVIAGRVLINLAYSNTMAAPDSNGLYWNDILSNSTNDNANTPAYAVLNLIDTDNAATTIDFTVVDGISEGYGDNSGANLNGGVGVGVDVGDYVYPAGRDSWFSESADPDSGGEWRLDGLDSGTTYTIKFWGSRGASGSRSIDIATDSGYTDVQTYNAALNTDPDVNASFTISGVTSQSFFLRSQSGSQFGYCGVIDILY
jgi:hypothetical protein